MRYGDERELRGAMLDQPVERVTAARAPLIDGVFGALR